MKIHKETECGQHRCEDCEENLVLAKYTWFGYMLFFIPATIMFVLSLIQFITIDEKQCYTRTYLSGRGTDIEVLRNQDIVCPK